MTQKEYQPRLVGSPTDHKVKKVLKEKKKPNKQTNKQTKTTKNNKAPGIDNLKVMS